jgi:hypothetical protein
MPRWSHQQSWYDRDATLARSQLDTEQWNAAWEQGYTMTLDQAVAYALLAAYGADAPN